MPCFDVERYVYNSDICEFLLKPTSFKNKYEYLEKKKKTTCIFKFFRDIHTHIYYY